MPNKKVSFKNDKGFTLAGKIDFPLTKAPYPFALFAHVFTGNKNLKGARHITRALNIAGIAVLRFDFTGLGESEGNFEDTNFSSNVQDLLAASEYLKEHYSAPEIIIGQSLGGAASIFAAKHIKSVKAIATIGAPCDPEHVMHLLSGSLSEIESTGQSEVKIDGRTFTIKKQFIDDLKAQKIDSVLPDLEKALLVLHSPQDFVVEIENAAHIYHKARHPKSFVTLDGADHMLTNKDDAFYTGQVIASWVERYIDIKEKEKLKTEKQVVARLGSEGWSTEILAGKHGFVVDESEKLGGNDFGPSPYELLNSALGACTAMTLQMYARRKNWDLQEVKVHLAYGRPYFDDCMQCDDGAKRLDHFERVIELKGNLSVEQKSRLVEIADRCPVHKTLASETRFTTTLKKITT